MGALFPLLRALGKPARLTEVRVAAAEAARQAIFGSSPSAPPPPRRRASGTAEFQCLYHAGEGLTIPMTFLGSCKEHGDQVVLVHVAGLPGAFPLSMEELARHRHLFSPRPEGTSSAADEAEQLALLCATEAVESGIRGLAVLDHLRSVSQRRLASLRGAEVLLKLGSRINEKALQLSFPYHCGSTHALKQYFDITHEACTLFGQQNRHGAKMLCRYGVAVMVGIAPDEALGCPVPFWNPLGEPAACLAPMFHGCHAIPVGSVKLDYNGPSTHSVLLTPEDPARYLNPTVDGKYDVTAWLNEGLFGVKVGQRVEDGCAVYGVCYNAERCEFELHVQDSLTGEIRPSLSCFLTPQ
ncbi:uncharacterized protein Tco025E_02293 [Trypanosoma conorhini]|uniref:Uncharacterized protein n=1 Tax=Trypanosoma conorhini TaxID=83891 RepID=A0A3R7LBN7_9TRYP|nr:uncharacterized protein Tco025E_02293 [Trypanosoma conorhini]RNF25145.1 hypothetical protein Tco025E_02293 [Trypanosoma conorhini]